MHTRQRPLDTLRGCSVPAVHDAEGKSMARFPTTSLPLSHLLTPTARLFMACPANLPIEKLWPFTGLSMPAV